MHSKVLVVLAFLAVLLAGCGGSSSSPGPTSTLTIQSGNWNISASSIAAPGVTFLAGGNLMQSGNSISGVVHIFNSTCFGQTTDVPVSGSVSGQSVTLSSPAIQGQTVTVSLNGSSTALSGTYSVAGTGCAAGDRGTVNANLVPSITGSWHGTFTSTANPGTTVDATADLTQSATADAHGLFAVTGTVTFTGSTCFTSGTIVQSVLAGGALELEITTNDQPTPGDIGFLAFMDNPSAANAATGLYQINAGTCSGDAGDGHITKP